MRRAAMPNPRSFVAVLFRSAAAILLLTNGTIVQASGAESWTQVSIGLPSSQVGIGGLVVDPTTPSTLYALSAGGSLFKSTNGAANWRPISNVAGVRSLVIDPRNPSTIYSGTDHGILKSADAGGSWIAADTGIGLSNSVITMMAIDPITASTIYAVTFGHIFKSTNAAGSWDEIGADIAQSTHHPPISVTVDPVTPSTLYAVSVYGDISKSTDAGATWNVIKGASQASFAAQVLSLAIDPITPSTLYAPSFAAFACCPRSANAGISKSTDGGQTWTAYNAGIPSGVFVRSLVIDPATPSVIYGTYVSDSRWGVIKSVDGGASWKDMGAGLPPGRGNGSLAIDPRASSIIYAGYFVTGTAGGAFKSTDGGGGWSESNTGLSSIDIRAVAVDPFNAATLYAGGAGGLFKTVNGGANWINSASFLIPPAAPIFLVPEHPIIRSLAIDSANSNILRSEEHTSELQSLRHLV